MTEPWFPLEPFKSGASAGITSEVEPRRKEAVASEPHFCDANQSAPMPQRCPPRGLAMTHNDLEATGEALRYLLRLAFEVRNRRLRAPVPSATGSAI